MQRWHEYKNVNFAKVFLLNLNEDLDPTFKKKTISNTYKLK